jgi:hypothetical protein
MLLDDLRTTLDGIRSHRGERYLAWPIPSSVDDNIATLIDQFASGDALPREDLTRSLSSPQVDVLIGFGIRMAILGVREQSVARLRLGLLAVALGGSSREADWRDVAAHLPPLEDAGLRIRADSRAAYIEAASIAKDQTAILIRAACPPRRAALRWAKRMKLILLGGGWRAVQAPDGFRYVVGNPISEAELMKRIENALDESSTPRQ